MDTEDCLTYLTSASYHSVKFTENYVKNKLFYNFKFNIKLNQSCDDHADEENDLYPEDNNKELHHLELREVPNILCRNGKVPEWIDVSVIAVGKDYTLIELLCSGRFTKEREKMCYSKRGQGPFGIKSPILPPHQKENKKFKLKKV